MRSIVRLLLAGASCAVILCSMSVTAAVFGGGDRANTQRHPVAGAGSPHHHIVTKRDELRGLADIDKEPVSFVIISELPEPASEQQELRLRLQSDPVEGLNSLRGKQQRRGGEIMDEHNIFYRFDQTPMLDARKGGGGKSGSSRSGSSSKGSKGSGSGGGKGSKNKTSKGGGSTTSSSTGNKSSSGSSSSGSKKSSSSEDKDSPNSASKSKKSDAEKTDSTKSSSSKSKKRDDQSADHNRASRSSSKSKSMAKKKKNTNSQRMCSTPVKKTCRNNCIDKRCDASDDESSPCAKRCRYKCCSDLQSDDRNQKKDGGDDDSVDDDEERSCNTQEEKACRNKCFHRKKCRDDECKRLCRRDCCVGGRVGGGSSRDSKKKNKSDDGADSEVTTTKDKGDDGGEEDGKGCDADVEKQCRDTCYIESSCEDGDRECRKTCRKGCCDVDISIVDIISNAQEQEGSAENDGSLMSGDVPLSFRFTINTSERFTANDIMNGRDNSLKEDLEGGLMILVEEMVGEMFRGDSWRQETSSRRRRRKLVVRYKSDSPPTVEDIQDVSCPSSVGGSGCKRVRAEATLELEDENENNVRQAFLSAISEAMGKGRLESAIRKFNPDHGARDPLSDETTSRSEDGGRKLSNLAIAGIAVGALAAVVLSYLAMREYQDRRRRKEERSAQGSSALDSAQQEAGYEDHPRGVEEHDAYNDAYGGDNYDQHLPPIPQPSQLPDRSSGKPRESKLSAVRRELQDQPDPYEPHTPQRALEAGGPSLVDLVATSYTPDLTTVILSRGPVDEGFDSTHQPPSEVSDEYYDGVQPPESAAHAQRSENTLDEYADHANDYNYGPPSSPHRYNDGGGQDGQGDRLDLTAPIDFSRQPAEASEYHEGQDQTYVDGEQTYAEDNYNKQYGVEETYQEDEEHYKDGGQYEEQAMATGSWGEQKHVINQYDYQGEYDEAPPDVAESDVSSKEGDAMTETSSQKFIETAKRMAAAEQDKVRRESEHDAIEDISDRSDDEEAHSQARAYRHRAQAERIGRKSKVSDLINRFESS